LGSLLAVNGERMPAANRRVKISDCVLTRNGRLMMTSLRRDCLRPMARRETLRRYSHRPVLHRDILLRCSHHPVIRRDILLREIHYCSYRRSGRCGDMRKSLLLVESRQAAAY